MSRINSPLAKQFVLAVILGATVVAPVKAETIRARYSVNLVGLHIGDATANGVLGPQSYKVDLNAHLTGFAALVVNLKTAFSSSGAILRGAIVPSAYATTSATSQETRTVRMALTNGSVKGLEISPPFEDKEGRVPLTEASKRNIVDPMSAFIIPVAAGESLVGPAACAKSIPIFDGFTRFDVKLSYAGTRNVSTQGYSGPVSVCTARYVPVAGHKPDSKSTRFMTENRQIEAWLAPVERARVVVPYRISLLTMAGMAVIEATDFNIESSEVAVH
jgi:hypothetical protein